MGEKSANPDSLLTLPVVLGVIVVIGGIAALLASGLFVFRARAFHAEAQRIQASLAEREQAGQEQIRQLQEEAEQAEAMAAEIAPQLPPALEIRDLSEAKLTSITVTTLKPGIRLQAQRPAHWDEAEIVDILADQKIKIRWLSGEPGEDVIATDLVRNDVSLAQ